MVSDWLGIPAAILAWGFAFYVFIVAPPTRGARFLVAMLIVDGLAVISSYGNGTQVNLILERSFGWSIPVWSEIHQASDWLLVAVYLPFIGMTLPSKLVAPFKSESVQQVILAGGIVIATAVFILADETRQLFNTPFYVVICIALAWGFAAAVHSWIIATSEAQRGRARAFTIAFGVRDVVWTITFTITMSTMYGFVDPGDLSDPLALGNMNAFFYALAVIVYVPLVAYGILRVQLFDVDLRIKRTIKRSTIAAAFVATFFIVSELAGDFLSSQFGTVLGVLCTGALVFLLDPIQRAAEKISDAAMPNTHDTPEYESYRKLQVYESALQAALEDGHISERQRRVLNSLMGSMGVDPNVAERLENDIRSGATG